MAVDGRLAVFLGLDLAPEVPATLGAVSGVDDLVQTAERAATVVRKMADDLVALDEGHEARATLLGHVANALELAAKAALAAPDETPPSGLDQLIDELEHPAALLGGSIARRLARRLQRGRSLVRQLLASAEITGDAELVAEAQKWLDEN